MLRAAWIIVFLGVLTWSGINPKDFMTWCLEVAPAVAGGIVLWFTRERFPLTPLAYVLILVHCVILMVGGHYTYAEVPLFDYLKPKVQREARLQNRDQTPTAQYAADVVLRLP